jgi:hypothetical protein
LGEITLELRLVFEIPESGLRITPLGVIQNRTGSKRQSDPTDAKAQRNSTFPKSLPAAPCK